MENVENIQHCSLDHMYCYQKIKYPEETMKRILVKKKLQVAFHSK